MDTSEKDDQTFKAVCDFMQCTPQNAWSIGNSLPSDINPALRIGMNAVWINANVWGYEKRERSPIAGCIYKIKSIAELPNIIRNAQLTSSSAKQLSI